MFHALLELLLSGSVTWTSETTLWDLVRGRRAPLQSRRKTEGSVVPISVQRAWRSFARDNALTFAASGLTGRVRAIEVRLLLAEDDERTLTQVIGRPLDPDSATSMIAGDAFRARIDGLPDARCVFDGGELRLEWAGMEDREDLLQTALDAVVDVCRKIGPAAIYR